MSSRTDNLLKYTDHEHRNGYGKATESSCDMNLEDRTG